MNIPLLVGGALAALLGAIHSFLGERLLLGPLFERGDLPRLLGSRTFARRTLRFTWHLTTVLLIGVGFLLAALSFSQIEGQTVWILQCLSVIFFACSAVSLIGSRGKHFSWYVFIIIAVLIWFGVR